MKKIISSSIFFFMLIVCSVLWNCNGPNSKMSNETKQDEIKPYIVLSEYKVDSCLEDIFSSALMAKQNYTHITRDHFFLLNNSGDKYKIITIQGGSIKRNELMEYDGVIKLKDKFIWCKGVKSDPLFLKTHRSLKLLDFEFIPDSAEIFPMAEEPSYSKIVKNCNGLPLLVEAFIKQDQ